MAKAKTVKMKKPKSAKPSSVRSIRSVRSVGSIKKSKKSSEKKKEKKSESRSRVMTEQEIKEELNDLYGRVLKPRYIKVLAGFAQANRVSSDLVMRVQELAAQEMRELVKEAVNATKGNGSNKLTEKYLANIKA
jgi:excinuclease UvrABC ATPase subunit